MIVMDDLARSGQKRSNQGLTVYALWGIRSHHEQRRRIINEGRPQSAGYLRMRVRRTRSSRPVVMPRVFARPTGREAFTSSFKGYPGE